MIDDYGDGGGEEARLCNDVEAGDSEMAEGELFSTSLPTRIQQDRSIAALHHQLKFENLTVILISWKLGDEIIKNQL